MKRNTLILISVLIALLPLARWIGRSRARAYDVAASSQEVGDLRGYLAGEVSARGAGRGNPWITLRDGHEAPAVYQGSSALIQQLADNQTRPLSLASADFDEDGVPDLVAGYAGARDGVISLRRGDVDAVFPNTPEAILHRSRLSAPPGPDSIQSPFFSTTRVFDVAGAPQFIIAGDFDADGHQDIVAAAAGSSSLVLLAGDGTGGFGSARSITLSGAVTALATGDANRMDGLADIVVAVTGTAGSKLLVYEGSAGALRTAPESIQLPSEARSIAIGTLDDDYPVDIAVASGRDLLVVDGRDRKRDPQQPRVARLTTPFAISSLAIGDFIGDVRNEIALHSEDAKLHIFSRTKSAKAASWQETGTVVLPASQKNATGSSRVLMPVRISTSPKEDLLILDQASRQLQMIVNDSETVPDGAAKSSGTASFRVAGAVDLDSEPVAMLGMRLNVDALSDLVVLSGNNSAPTIIPSAPAATFTVTNTNDSGAGSLRQAMISANTMAGADMISFAIPASGTQTITPLTPLPTMLQTITIDGTTQNPGSATPPIEIAGNSAGGSATGLNLSAISNTVRGLVINRFDGVGINLSNSNAIVEGNFIGTNSAGTAAQGNGDAGVLINGGTGHMIGGTTSAARNIISGNIGQGVQVLLGPATGHLIQGNFIGTDVTGAIDLGNVNDGVSMVSGITNIMNCTIGGTAAGARNVISGNEGAGVQFLTVGTSNLVQGNLIGTDVTGSNDLGNTVSGIAITECANSTIGGSVAGAGNVISGNDFDGVHINSATSTGNLVQGNKIGTRLDGVTPLHNNSEGVIVLNSASNNTIGGATAAEGNIIASNFGAGVTIESGTGNAIRTNSIFSNTGLGIDLSPAGVTPNDVNDGDTGANNRQNFPVLTSAKGAVGGGVNIQGTLNSTANTTFSLDFFASPSCDASGNGEGRTFLGTADVTTVGNNVTFNITLPGASASVGQSITATATSPAAPPSPGSTSEFSACIPYGAADLSISKAVSSPTIVAGSSVTYTITLTNLGPDPASSISVSDTLPASVTFSMCSSTGGGVCGGLGNIRNVSFATLGSGASATITLVATLSCSVANGAIVSNTASVTGAVTDPVSGNNSSTITFTASNPARMITPTSESYSSDGGDGTVSVTAPAGCGWVATSNASWLSITSGSFGSGNGMVGYHVDVNSTGSPRVGTLTIAGVTFTVNQSNVPCSFEVVPLSNSFPFEGGNASVSVTAAAGCIWKAISNDPWITLPPESGGTGNGSADYTVELNNTASARIGTMTIAGQTFTVNQAGNPSAVTLVSFTASGYDNGVLVQWQTGMEVENLGFRVYREQAGQRVRVTPEIVAGSALIAGARTTMTAGNSYSWWDGGVGDCGSRLADCRDIRYWLEDIDLDGKTTVHGPIAPVRISGAPPGRSTAALLSQMGRGEPQSRQLALNHQGSVSAAQKHIATPWDAASQPAIKLTIREEGWYRLSQPELLAAGLDPRTDPRNLRLYLEGNEHAMLVTGEQDGSFDQADAVEFFATGQDTPVTDAHTYWLTGGKQPGRRIGLAKSDAKPGGAASFAYTVERREKTIYFSSLRNGDAGNFFGQVIAAQPVDQVLLVQHLDPSPPQEAVLEIALQGVTDRPGIGNDHQVRLMLNGVQVGRMMFDGRQHPVERINLPRGLLRDGDNTVTFIAEGGPSDVSLADYVRLTYWHRYSADRDALRMTVEDSAADQSQTVDGFSSASIRVVDVTNPAEPLELAGRIEAQQAGGFAVTVGLPEGQHSGPRTLIAFGGDQVKRPALVAANQPSSWRDAGRSADMLIITRAEFVNSLAPLRALRQQQGLSVETIDVADIYDEFSYGEKEPRAIKDFLSSIRANWKKAPRFILLAGDASFDPRDYLGAGDFDFVPTKLIDTAYLETASDDWYADFNDDGIAEMYVGRLPVRTSAEAASLVTKIVNYDSARTPLGRRTVLLVSDANDGFNFELASEQLRALVPSGTKVQEILRGRMENAVAKRQLIEAINAGQSIVNYTGHGSVNVWRNLFGADDIRSLSNQQLLPLFVSMTCLNGFFHDPVNESLAEGLLKSDRGGAILVWASSGMTEPPQQTVMNQQAYRLLFDTRGGLTIGEVTAQAKKAVQDGDVRRTWLLFGDPSSRLK